MRRGHQRIELRGAVEAVHGITDPDPELVQTGGTACCTISAASPPSVLLHSQIHMPLPESAVTSEVHGAGTSTGGRVVTRFAGCHGGGEGEAGGCGGTGQPASATWPDPVGAVVVVAAGGGAGRAGRPRGRVAASSGRRSREDAKTATRPEPVETPEGFEPDVATSVAIAATALKPSTTAPVTHERFLRPDKSTFHCRGPSDQAHGGPASTSRAGPQPSPSSGRTGVGRVP